MSQLPFGVRLFSYAFPLTYFCHACREINVYSGGIANVAADLILLSLGALVTCLIATLRPRQTELWDADAFRPCSQAPPNSRRIAKRTISSSSGNSGTGEMIAFYRILAQRIDWGLTGRGTGRCLKAHPDTTVA